MWRFGIGATLLLVLGGVVAEMFFGEQTSVFDMSLRLLPSYYSDPSAATDDTMRSLATGELVDDWTADRRAGRSAKEQRLAEANQ